MRHQYVEYGQKAVSTTVDVGGDEGAGKVKAGLCRDSTPSPVMTRTVARDGTRFATLRSGTSTSSKIYDLGVIGRKSASRYRMTGRWYRNYERSKANRQCDGLQSVGIPGLYVLRRAGHLRK